MGRKLIRTIPEDEDTADRRLVLTRMKDDELRLEDVGAEVGRPKSFVSQWIHHRSELADAEIERWAAFFDCEPSVFVMGRFESRRRFAEAAA